MNSKNIKIIFCRTKTLMVHNENLKFLEINKFWYGLRD